MSSTTETEPAPDGERNDLRQAYEQLVPEEMPRAHRRLMRSSAEQHDGFHPGDIRVVERHPVPGGDCYLAVTSSDATPGNEPEGVWAVFALLIGEDGKPAFISRGDTDRVGVAASRYAHLRAELAGELKLGELSGSDVAKLLRARLRNARR